MSKENTSLEELWHAKDLIDEYQNWHPIRTRKWHSIVIGESEQLKDTPWEEWAEVPGIIVGVDFGTEVKPKTRLDITTRLGAAGLDHIPVAFIESTRLKPALYSKDRDKPKQPQ
jgi:hypothetical protein